MAREEIKLINPIKFVRSPARHGSNENDYIFTIPRNLIKTGYIDPKKTYKLYLEELEEEIEVQTFPPGVIMYDEETGKYIAVKDWNPTKKELQELIKKSKEKKKNNLT